MCMSQLGIRFIIVGLHGLEQFNAHTPTPTPIDHIYNKHYLVYIWDEIRIAYCNITNWTFGKHIYWDI